MVKQCNLELAPVSLKKQSLQREIYGLLLGVCMASLPAPDVELTSRTVCCVHCTCQGLQGALCHAALWEAVAGCGQGATICLACSSKQGSLYTLPGRHGRALWGYLGNPGGS